MPGAGLLIGAAARSPWRSGGDEQLGKEIEPGVWVGPNTSISWESSKIAGPVYIGSGVKIEYCCAWIGHGSHLRKGAKVIRSVLFEYTRVWEWLNFPEMNVSPRYCVDRVR